jgi:FAD/FMN-containing dehydrogenase
MARIKQAIDPANTFNPGRVLPCTPSPSKPPL